MSFDLLATLGIIIVAAGYLVYRFRKPSSGCCGCNSCPSDSPERLRNAGCSGQNAPHCPGQNKTTLKKFN